jgi:hypothetical protein
MDGIMQGFAKMNTAWKEDLYFVMKFAQQKLSKHRTKFAPLTRQVFIFAYIVYLCHKLHLFS